MKPVPIIVVALVPASFALAIVFGAAGAAVFTAFSRAHPPAR